MTEADNMKNTSHTASAGLLRRLLAVFYDSLLLASVLFFVSVIFIFINHGDAVEPENSLFPFYMFFIVGASYLYFAWFWIHGGQSPGMKTWRLKLLSENGLPMTWKMTVMRFVCAILSWCTFGLGFIWSLFDYKKRCWHDIISNTILVDLRNKK